MDTERPLQLPGAVNADCAMLAEQAGFRALYLSGAGVANASFGLPDVGLTTLEDVLADVRRIAGAVSLPLLVDADTGWEPEVARSVRELQRAGAAGCHIEDQVEAKRCGHLPGKTLVTPVEMTDRLKAAADGRSDAAFLLVARTDALAVEGFQAAIDRAGRYVDAGADAVFLEAAGSLEDYRRFAAAVPVPLLANMTEFGRTPLFSLQELRQAGVRMVIYPLSAFRAMSAAAVRVYETLRRDGSQKSLLGDMQARAELYKVLRYRASAKEET